MCKVKTEDHQTVDYIFCLAYGSSDAVQSNCQPLEVTDTTICCNLEQRQRSSQQILDLADYLLMHSNFSVIRRWNSPSSFSSQILPLWVEHSNPKSFFDYVKEKFESDDVMLIHNNPSNLYEIKEFCREQHWRCTDVNNVRGSEASVTILYDLDVFLYEFLIVYDRNFGFGSVRFPNRNFGRFSVSIFRFSGTRNIIENRQKALFVFETFIDEERFSRKMVFYKLQVCSMKNYHIFAVSFQNLLQFLFKILRG